MQLAAFPVLFSLSLFSFFRLASRLLAMVRLCHKLRGCMFIAYLRGSKDSIKVSLCQRGRYERVYPRGGLPCAPSRAYTTSPWHAELLLCTLTVRRRCCERRQPVCDHLDKPDTPWGHAGRLKWQRTGGSPNFLGAYRARFSPPRPLAFLSSTETSSAGSWGETF